MEFLIDNGWSIVVVESLRNIGLSSPDKVLYTNRIVIYLTDDIN